MCGATVKMLSKCRTRDESADNCLQVAIVTSEGCNLTSKPTADITQCSKGGCQ